MKEIIQKAMEGGYVCNESMALEYFGEIFLDPLFWQALGNSLGWKEEIEIFMDDYHNDHPFMGGTLDYPYDEGAGMTFNSEEWKYKWHSFIDHLAEGKEAEEFFKQLLDNK